MMQVTPQSGESLLEEKWSFSKTQFQLIHYVAPDDFCKIEKNVEMWVHKRPTLGSQSLPLSTTSFLMKYVPRIKGQNWAKSQKMVFSDHEASVIFLSESVKKYRPKFWKRRSDRFLGPPCLPPPALRTKSLKQYFAGSLCILEISP